MNKIAMNIDSCEITMDLVTKMSTIRIYHHFSGGSLEKDLR